MRTAVARPEPLERPYPPPRLLTPPEIEIPAWRGLSHEKAFAFAPAASILLVASAAEGRERMAAAVFALTASAMLAASMLNHRAALSGPWPMRFRRADHAGIGIFVIGTWTSFALAVPASDVALAAGACAVALATPLATTVSLRLPRWITAVLTVGAGLCAATLVPAIALDAGSTGTALFVAGGLSYMAGAVVYALRRPELGMEFGHHELFHAFVLVGVACHYATIALAT